MTFDLNEGHHRGKLAPAVLLTKFGSPRALFNVFDPRGPKGPRTPYPCKTFVATPLYMLLTKFVIKLDSLSPIHKFIGQAMSWGKYWARRYVEPNIFPTHGETNKFVYWMKNRIQFYHYYVLRILCPISLYTFLNKQISNKREKINLLCL